MHKFHSFTSDRNVRVGGSARIYSYTTNLGHKMWNTGVWTFLFAPMVCIESDSSGHCWVLPWKQKLWLACLVFVRRILAVLKMPVWDTSCTYPKDGGSKLLQHVSTACAHCTISHNTANFTHNHHWEKPKYNYCMFLFFNAFIAWRSGKRQLPQFILTFEGHISCAWTTYCLHQKEILSNSE